MPARRRPLKGQAKRSAPIEQLLWLITLLCAVYSGFAWQQAHGARVRAAARPLPVTHIAMPGEVMGRIAIPAIGLSVPVLEDDAARSLLRGVGHIRGTAMPGGLGTVGLAGHRDTFLRPLENIAPAMEIDLSRGDSMFRYQVDRTEIVHPEAVEVLDQQNTPELVLVTCYPFHYIGAAPMRFIVHAHLLSLTPQPIER